MRKFSRSVFLGSGFGPAVRPGVTILLIALAALLSGCHGGTLDVLYPEGSFGHEQPPAVNLPPQDAGLENR